MMPFMWAKIGSGSLLLADGDGDASLLLDEGTEEGRRRTGSMEFIFFVSFFFSVGCLSSTSESESE
jgi:hypothetical protein